MKSSQSQNLLLQGLFYVSLYMLGSTLSRHTLLLLGYFYSSAEVPHVCCLSCLKLLCEIVSILHLLVLFCCLGIYSIFLYAHSRCNPHTDNTLPFCHIC